MFFQAATAPDFSQAAPASAPEFISSGSGSYIDSFTGFGFDFWLSFIKIYLKLIFIARKYPFQSAYRQAWVLWKYYFMLKNAIVHCINV